MSVVSQPNISKTLDDDHNPPPIVLLLAYFCFLNCIAISMRGRETHDEKTISANKRYLIRFIIVFPM